MNIPNQQRWRNLFRGRHLARYTRLKSTLDSSFVNLSSFGLSLKNPGQPFATTALHLRSCVVFESLGNVPLQPQDYFQKFCLAIVWRLIEQYTRIAGDTS
ncbi:hypothetical protein [Planktothrix tepida]|nr:hypothetical protein [Planktothrix tepida]